MAFRKPIQTLTFDRVKSFGECKKLNIVKTSVKFEVKCIKQGGEDCNAVPSLKVFTTYLWFWKVLGIIFSKICSKKISESSLKTSLIEFFFNNVGGCRALLKMDFNLNFFL